jgi:GST-like protein
MTDEPKMELLYVPTANGQKATILLEETGVVYTATRVTREPGAPPTEEILHINPIGRYPVLTDPAGPGGPVTVFESLAIAEYLTEITGQLVPADSRERVAAKVWAAVACTDLTPTMATQYFLTLRAKTDVTEAREWIESEAHRFLRAYDRRLGEAEYLAGGEYSYADALTYPLMATSVQRLDGGYAAYGNIGRWAAQVGAREAVQRGMAAAS